MISATIVSLSATGTTGTLVTSSSIAGLIGESVYFSGATGASATYWNNGTFTFATVNNSTFTYTFPVSGGQSSSSTGTATTILRNNTMFQATTAGTTGTSEPQWINCAVLGTTCADGTAVWTNIGPVGGQGPGFDIMNYRPGIGCTRLNTRLTKTYRGGSTISLTQTRKNW